MNNDSMFSLYLRQFSPRLLASTNSLKTCMRGILDTSMYWSLDVSTSRLSFVPVINWRLVQRVAPPLPFNSWERLPVQDGGGYNGNISQCPSAKPTDRFNVLNTTLTVQFIFFFFFGNFSQNYFNCLNYKC